MPAHKIPFLVLLLLCAGCSSPGGKPTVPAFRPAGTDWQRIRTVAILPLSEPASQAPRSYHLGEIRDEPNPGGLLADRLGEQLLASGRFRVLERSHIKRILDEQDFSLSDSFDAKNAIKLGNLMAADALLVGQVVKAENFNRAGTRCWRLTANLRMIDTRSGELLMSATIDRGREIKNWFGGPTLTELADIECRRIVGGASRTSGKMRANMTINDDE